MKDNMNEEAKLVLDIEKADKLVVNWIEKLEVAQKGHYSETECLNKIHQWLGFVLISLTTGVTAFIFYDPSEDKELIKLLIAIASATAAALSGVVTFGRFGERANEHRITAGRYGKLRRQLELLQSSCSGHTGNAEFRGKLKTLRIEWEYVAANAPLTPNQTKRSWFDRLFKRK
ncbi:SLATT domain-containing protein [Vibrio splendidus]